MVAGFAMGTRAFTMMFAPPTGEVTPHIPFITTAFLFTVVMVMLIFFVMATAPAMTTFLMFFMLMIVLAGRFMLIFLRHRFTLLVNDFPLSYVIVVNLVWTRKCHLLNVE